MASREEIIREIEALAEHYIRPVRPPDAYSRWLKDYLDDLKAYPIEAIQHGCRSWRQSDAVRFPTTGQLVAFVRKNVRSDNPVHKNEAWRPLTDDQYERLTMEEKIRHRQIMATRALNAAGPQCIDKRAVAAEEMPERWRDLRARARAHTDEARRLRELLNAAKAKAVLAAE